MPQTRRGLLRRPTRAALLIPLGVVCAQGTRGSNTQPLAFGPDQVISDLNKLVWVPLEAEGVPPGPEIAVLRGDGKAAGFEVVVRLPAHDTFPNHSHTSDEHYVWLKGDFTHIAADGTATPLRGQTSISLPGVCRTRSPVARSRVCFTRATRSRLTRTCTPCPR